MSEPGFIIDYDKVNFEIYENYFLAHKEWERRLGLDQKGLSYDEIDKRIREGHLDYLSRKAKGYYGTVWVAYKWGRDNKALHLAVSGKYKDIKNYKLDGYSIKKKVFKEYEK